MGRISLGFWETLSEQGNTESSQSIMKNLVMKWGDFSLDDREGGEVLTTLHEGDNNSTVSRLGVLDPHYDTKKLLA